MTLKTSSPPPPPSHCRHRHRCHSRRLQSIANGPFRSRLEEKIYSIICKKIHNNNNNNNNNKNKEQEKVKIEINKTGLVPQNKRLELDLYFPDLQLGIEIQGPCHWMEATRILKDYDKMRYFQALGINIVYIYTNSTKQMNRCIDRCIEVIENRSF